MPCDEISTGRGRALFDYPDPTAPYDFAYASAVSPLGTLLFVTGWNQADYVTVAFPVG